jgi:hypothetical protein
VKETKQKCRTRRHFWQGSWRSASGTGLGTYTTKLLAEFFDTTRSINDLVLAGEERM